MIQLSRRSLLTGTVAASAASALTPLAGSTSFAAAPPVGKQNSGWYRYKVGSYELTVLLDGVRPVKLDNSPIRNAKLEEVKAVLASLHVPEDKFGIYFHPTVVNTGSKLVLIDTGNGPGGRQTGTGLTQDYLAGAGIDAKA